MKHPPWVFMFTVHLKNIVVGPDRGRKSFTRIAQLAESLAKYGLINPICVAPREDGKWDLVAGERRYRAAILAGLSEVPATTREESLDILAEIELEENVNREDLSFEEEGNILRKIQELKQSKDASWTMEKTAQMTSRSIGDVSSKISIAKKFEERPDLREACKDLPHYAAVKKVNQIEQAEKVKRMANQGLIEITTSLQHGSCVDLIKTLETDSVDLLLTDPPYGLENLEALRKNKSKAFSGHSLMSDTHNQTLPEVEILLKALAPELGRVLKPSSHFYMFCGFQYIGHFVEALQPHLEFKPPILIWDRGKPSAPAYGYNYMSRAECIIFGHVPPQSKRLTTNKYNIFVCPDVPKNLRMYPTEKPTPLLQEFIKNSTNYGDVVLDPFAGSASTLIAAKKCGRQGLGFEIDETAYLRAQERIIKEPET